MPQITNKAASGGEGRRSVSPKALPRSPSSRSLQGTGGFADDARAPDKVPWPLRSSAARASILRGPRDEKDEWTRHRSGPNSLGAKNMRWKVHDPLGARREPAPIHGAPPVAVPRNA